MEELLGAFLENQQQMDQETKEAIQTLTNILSNMEDHMGLIATTLNQSEQRRIPSQPEVNPRDHEQFKAITTL